MTDPGVLCSIHQVPLYEDVRDIEPMGRYLCPRKGCTVILAADQLAADQLAAVRDQAWCEDNGMTAPGWQTLTVSPPGWQQEDEGS